MMVNDLQRLEKMIETVRLGLMAPLTGLVSLYGQEISWAARIACDEVNEQGGILGKSLELIIVNDGSLPDTALLAANTLINEHHCLAMIGNLLSNSRIAVAGMVAEPRRIPYLNFSFYEGSIFNPYFFHFAALPNQQIDYMIPYMAKNFGPKMFFVGSNYEWPRGSINAAKEALLGCDGEILGEEYLELGTTRIHKLLNEVSVSGADVLVPYFAGHDQINLLMQFTTMGLKKRMAVVMGHYDEAMASQLPPLVREGFFSSNTYFMTVNTQTNYKYLKKLSKQDGVTGIWPKGNGILTNFGEGAYLCVHAYAKAVNQAGSFNTEKILEALRHVQIEGLQGKVTMDPDTQHAHVNSYLSQCNMDGTFSIVEKFGCQAPRIPERYRGISIKNDLSETQISNINTVIPGTLNPVAVLDDNARLVFFNHRFKEIFFSRELNNGIFARELWEQPASFDSVFEKVKHGVNWQGQLLVAGAAKGSEALRLALEAVPARNNINGTYLLYCFPNDLISMPIQDDPFKHIFDIAGIAIIATDETGVIQQINYGASILFGYTVGELLGLSVHLLLPPHLRGYHAQAMQRFVKGGLTEIPMGHRGEISGYRKDGSMFPASASVAKFKYQKNWMLVVTLQDISEKKRAEEDMLWRANHDSLTGLANRALITERLTNALQRTRRSGLNVALLFVDLDNFKLINDTFGHSAGDQVLVRVAEIITDNVSSGDIICRLGGDEYVVLCDQVEDSEQIIFLAQRMNEALRTSITIKGTEIYITASIGLAFGHGSTHSADDLLRESDAAMYVTKEQGRDSYRVFSDKIHTLAQQRLTISNGLRYALERNEFLLQFQPIVVANNGYICGAEALLRWNPPSGPISPATFIPIAEANGAIVSIGKWVFREACRARTRFQNIFKEMAPYVSVNVSTRQLNEENLVNDFAQILTEEATDAQGILIEITETSLMSDAEMNLRILRGLSDLGLKIAVDDFGTGYSSLLQLLRMPVSTIKIDREFVDGLDKRQDSRSITAAIARMARSLGKKLIAEGVENEIQQLELINLDVDYLQGFLFSRPVNETEFVEKIFSQRSVRIIKNVEVYYTIYVSEAVIHPSKEELNIILEESRLFNKNFGVTGLLIYSSGCFMQMIEGREEVIIDLMARISMDSRHHHVQEIVSGRSKYRLFQNWDMGLWNMELSHNEEIGWRKTKLDLKELSKNVQLCIAFFDTLSKGRGVSHEP